MGFIALTDTAITPKLWRQGEGHSLVELGFRQSTARNKGPCIDIQVSLSSLEISSVVLLISVTVK